MADVNNSLNQVLRLEYGNNPKKALEKVQGESFLTYKGLQEKDDTAFPLWGKIHSTLEQCNGDKAAAGMLLETDYTLQKTVVEFFKSHYWDAIRGDEIAPQHTADEMMVAAVLYSAIPAIRMAQSVIGVKADGILGPKTLEALNNFDASIFDKLYDVEEVERAEMLGRSPRLAWAVNGWVNRAKEV
jgi:lysozyme family protein